MSAPGHGVRMRVGLLLGLALFVSACSRRAPAPPRPAGVPDDAVWAGGPEGGAFISCLAVGREPTDVFECGVFQDRSGTVVARGRFITRPTFQASLRELRRSYAAFDGSSILLVNGVALSPDSSSVPFAHPNAPARE